MLFTRSILLPPHYEDGLRVSVMSRHTLNDGKTPDSRIQKYHVHIPYLGPSPRLIGGYYKGNMSWLEFEKKYRAEMDESLKRMLIRFFATLGLETDITLLCVEEKPEFCHRRILAEECQKYQPALKVVHL